MRKSILGLGVMTLLALGVVQQRVSLVSVGYEVEKLRHIKDDLLDQNRVLNYNVLILQSPVILNRRLAQRDIQLAPPQQVEILRPVPQGVPSARPSGPSASGPTWLERTKKLAVRVLGDGRQAEAKPEL